MLTQRIFTAMLLVPATIAGIFFTTPFIFLFILSIIYVICAWEWSGLTAPRDRVIVQVTLVTGLLVSLSWCWQGGASPLQLDSFVIPALIAIAIPWWLIALCMVLTYPKTKSYWQHPLFKSLVGFFVLLPFFYAFYSLCYMPAFFELTDGRWIIFYVIGLIWFTDTGAYFVGSMFGQRKLVVQVSPSKTWAGFFGGLGAAMLLAVSFIYFMEFSQADAFIWFLSSVLSVLASILGDLTESLFKREAGVKDSGKILPGHGGILDRVDSLTAALPVFFLSILLFY